jgi:putative PIN family toxin of toxin-antitoxin system
LRAVLDPNVIISAALSSSGSPALALRLWLEGAYELVCSPLLLEELTKALTYPKLRAHIDADQAAELLDLLRRGAQLVEDPSSPPDISSSDPDDNYLIALAAATRSVLVSGDGDLLDLSDQIPVYSPRDFLSLVDDAP